MSKYFWGHNQTTDMAYTFTADSCYDLADHTVVISGNIIKITLDCTGAVLLIKNFSAALEGEEGLSPALLTSARQFFSELRGVAKEEAVEVKNDLSPAELEMAKLMAEMKAQSESEEDQDDSEEA